MRTNVLKDAQKKPCSIQDAERSCKGVVFVNGCDKTAVAALRYLSEHDRPQGGESTYNGEHLWQIADELEKSIKLIRPQPQSKAVNADTKKDDLTNLCKRLAYLENGMNDWETKHEDVLLGIDKRLAELEKFRRETELEVVSLQERVDVLESKDTLPLLDDLTLSVVQLQKIMKQLLRGEMNKRVQSDTANMIDEHSVENHLDNLIAKLERGEKCTQDKKL